eukprot:NODE_4740_length_1853_cov_4.754925.p1 GENE.NODE_4740_length_1853_cov_4.754925~~NODE_4740_length_1853_cov_4.754925.p1  ORF type:complete len:509 (-),score=165.89 NODE_4740_length_1853_cov_4.754925:240-1766(-)
MCIRDCGSVCFVMPSASEILLARLDAIMKESSASAVQLPMPAGDDAMWDYEWVNTRLTSGMTLFSRAPAWFPNGRLLVKLLNTLAHAGWDVADAPNFGGADGDCRDITWPVFVFESSRSGGAGGTFTGEHLIFAANVEDASGRSRLCAAGPPDAIEVLGKAIARRLEVSLELGDGATWDAIWPQAALANGRCLMQSSYFPKGRALHNVLEECYKIGWRLAAAPSFGGGESIWPCLVLRRLSGLLPVTQPPLLLMAVKDQSSPGKICFSGGQARIASEAVAAALLPLPGNSEVRSGRDEFDVDWDAALRGTALTTGERSSASHCGDYFPRADAVLAALDALNWQGWSLASCVNFGGDNTWPTLVFEQRGERSKAGLVAIEETDAGASVYIAGAHDAAEGILVGFRMLGGSDVMPRATCWGSLDSWDKPSGACLVGSRLIGGFDLVLANAPLTTGVAGVSMHRPWVPQGYAIEMVLSELETMGWRLASGANFGTSRELWPALVLERPLAS